MVLDNTLMQAQVQGQCRVGVFQSMLMLPLWVRALCSKIRAPWNNVRVFKGKVLNIPFRC